jgi:hypothetical protein
LFGRSIQITLRSSNQGETPEMLRDLTVTAQGSRPSSTIDDVVITNRLIAYSTGDEYGAGVVIIGGRKTASRNKIPFSDWFVRNWVEAWYGGVATGDEYGGTFVLAKVGRMSLAHDPTDPTEIPLDTEEPLNDSLQRRAAAIARKVPAVEVERPGVPRLTGNLLEDARAVTGLTIDQIAQAMRVSGRAVASWRTTGVPRHRQGFVKALRAIGISLVGGLGPSGVQRWFLAGTPSRLSRLAAADVDSVVAEARSYETSPAT